MANKALVVDANILIRAVLGNRVRRVIERFSDEVVFLVPELAHREAHRHLIALTEKRGADPIQALILLETQVRLCELIGPLIYSQFETEARARLKTRDPSDWPILATALVFGCPIWTEDNDFFGCGVATWTSDRIEIFLRQ